MEDKFSFQNAFQALTKALNLTKSRHELLASNISNVETPGYRPKDIDFKAVMARTLESTDTVDLIRTDAGHMDPGKEREVGLDSVENVGEWNGLNWVEIDSMMTKLMENNLMYRISTEALMRKITMLREVIREGGR
jgi:flagellar basal-body rod protein FlgB